MMGQQARSESLFYYFRLEDQIPKDHLLRIIDELIDLSFVRERVKDLQIQPQSDAGPAAE
jgi:transposase